MNTLLCVLFIPLCSPRTVTRDDLLSHSCLSPKDGTFTKKALPCTPRDPHKGLIHETILKRIAASRRHNGKVKGRILAQIQIRLSENKKWYREAFPVDRL